jgi:hypothetical protein
LARNTRLIQPVIFTAQGIFTVTYNFIVTVGGWQFEIKQVRAIRAEKYGKPYSATLMINIVNGTAYIENFLAREGDKINKQDIKTITYFMKSIGFNKVVFDRYKDGVNKTKTVSI